MKKLLCAVLAAATVTAGAAQAVLTAVPPISIPVSRQLTS